MTEELIKEPISKVDTAWLRMEQPTNLMMINGVIMLDEHLDYASLIKTIEQRFLTFRRFRQKAVDGARGAAAALARERGSHSRSRSSLGPPLCERIAAGCKLALHKPIVD